MASDLSVRQNRDYKEVWIPKASDSPWKFPEVIFLASTPKSHFHSAPLMMLRPSVHTWLLGPILQFHGPQGLKGRLAHTEVPEEAEKRSWAWPARHPAECGVASGRSWGLLKSMPSPSRVQAPGPLGEPSFKLVDRDTGADPTALDSPGSQKPESWLCPALWPWPPFTMCT